MKDLFLCLLINIGKFGKTTLAHFYGEDFVQIKLEDSNNEYDITITRRDKNQEEKKDD